jgi:hypothetical protein
MHPKADLEKCWFNSQQFTSQKENNVKKHVCVRACICIYIYSNQFPVIHLQIIGNMAFDSGRVSQAAVKVTAASIPLLM